MKGPINVIKFKYISNATLERHWKVMIDKTDIIDFLEQAVEAPIAGHWPSKSKALLNLDELLRSISVPGQMELLICANCAASGYKSCGDLDLKPFTVSFEDGLVVWEVKAPNPGLGTEETKLLRYKFDRPQYEAEVKKVVGSRRPT